jgi:hypothetical protein
MENLVGLSQHRHDFANLSQTIALVRTSPRGSGEGPGRAMGLEKFG